MRHEYERAAPTLEEGLKPFDGVDVEVVGGLVKEEEVGRGDQSPRQQHPPLHARGERLEENLAHEAHAREDLVDRVLPLPGGVMLRAVAGIGTGLER